MYRLLLSVRDARDGYKSEAEGQKLWSGPIGHVHENMKKKTEGRKIETDD